MSNRDEWEFEYTARNLAEAAAKKKTHREGRVAWWKDEMAKIMDEVRESGISVSESVAAQYNTTSLGHGPQVTIDTNLQRKLNECHSKIRQHADAVIEYDGWAQVLSANPESRMKLTHEDWLFFFGADK